MLMPGTGNEEPASGALRLTFSYQGSSVELVNRQPLDVMPPPSDELESFEGRSGFWYELRNASSEPVYRRIIESPVKLSYEGPPDSSESASDIQRVPIESPQGTFSLTVPDRADATTLALVSSPRDAATLAEPATDLAVFDIREANA